MLKFEGELEYFFFGCRSNVGRLRCFYYAGRCWIQSAFFCDLDGGRGSTASQRTHGELAPIHAAGKVPVP